MVDQSHLGFHNVTINIICYAPILLHYILSVSLGLLLSTMVCLSFQINARKNMHTEGFRLFVQLWSLLWRLSAIKVSSDYVVS